MRPPSLRGPLDGLDCVDSHDEIEAEPPALDEMIGDRLVTLERVDVRVHRAGNSSGTDYNKE